MARTAKTLTAATAAPPKRAVPKPPPPVSRRRRFDATSLLILIAILRVILPSRLVVGALGGAGTPAALLGLVGLIWWIYGRLVPGSGLARGRQPVRVALAIFMAAMIISYIAAFTTRFILGNEVNNADRTLIGLASLSGIVLLAADGIETIERLNTLLKWLILLSAILAFWGLVQFFTGFDISTIIKIPGLQANLPFDPTATRSVFRRISVTASHPIEFGVFLACMWPLAVHYSLWARTRGQAWLRWFGVALISIALMMTLSRSAILGVLAAGVIIIAPWTWRRKVNALVVIAMFTALMRVLVPGLVGTLRGLFTQLQSDSSYQARTVRYPAAFHFIHQAPIFGRGVGTLLGANLYPVVPLDNQLLATTIEAGLVGLFALLAMFGIGVFTARGARRRAYDPETRELGQAIAAALVACLISFATFDAGAYPMVMGALGFLLGASGALWRLTAAEQRRRESVR